MAKNPLDMIVQQKIAQMMGTQQNQQQPQTVVNNYIPGAPGAPVVGDAVSVEDVYQGFGEELEAYGDDLELGIIDMGSSYGDAELDDIADDLGDIVSYAYGSAEVPRDVADKIGGIRDRYRNWRRGRGRATNRDLTGKQTSHAAAIKELERDINSQRRINRSQGKALRKANTRLKALEATAGNSTMDIVYRELRALPGLRAFSLATSEQMIDYVDAVGDALDHNLKPATLAGAATLAAPGSAADAQAAAIGEIDKVRAAVAELIENQTALLEAFSKAATGKKKDDLLEILKDNSLHKLAVLLPEQYTDMEKALVSSGVRYVGGTVPTTEGRNLFGYSY